MKNYISFTYFLFVVFLGFSQKKATKKFTITTKEIAIYTEGLDDLVIGNSDSDFVEIFLYAENPNEQHIVVEEKNTKTEIKFKIPVFKNEDAVFRKYITERLKRATATIKLPKNIDISVFGETINIASKSYKGNLRFFIEKGIMKLDTIEQNLELKMYAGAVFGSLKNTNLSVTSKTGNIKVDSVSYQKKYAKKNVSATRKVSITTIKGNIFLRHLITQ